MDLGFFTLDFFTVQQFFEIYTTTQIVFFVLGNIGWIVFVGLLIFVFFHYLEEYRESKYTKDWKPILLAVDIPAVNVQSAQGVEQFFSQLYGAYDPPSVYDRYMRGHKQHTFSLEIVSIEGYIQFLIRSDISMRDLVETSIYAQYPEAEITEVEDYTKDFPVQYPNDAYDVWASDFALSENQAFPIRTYEAFEQKAIKLSDSKSTGTDFSDPMSSFLESFSRIGTGEQIWFQILIKPAGNDWKEKSINKIKEMMGEKSDTGGKSPLGFLTDNPISKEFGASAQEIVNQLGGGAPGEGADSSTDKKDDKPVRLTPGQNKLIEAMEEKISKNGFKTKMRVVYIAKKENFNTNRVVNAIIGSINQYNVPTSNSIVPMYSTGTAFVSGQFSVNYKQVMNYRKRLLVKSFIKRSAGAGGKDYVLNTKELATVWHFPLSHVKTPLLEKASGKRAEPPTGLPIGEIVAEEEELYRPDAQDEYHASGGDYSSEQHYG